MQYLSVVFCKSSYSNSQIMQVCLVLERSSHIKLFSFPIATMMEQAMLQEKFLLWTGFFPEHQNQSQFTSLDNSFERFRLEKKKKRKKVFDLNEAQTEQACLFGSTEQNIYNFVMLFPSKQLIHIPCFKSSLQNADFLY